MQAEEANKLKLEIWREIVRREPERNYQSITQGGSLGVRMGAQEAATQALAVFAILYPPTLTVTAPAKKRRK